MPLRRPFHSIAPLLLALLFLICATSTFLAHAVHEDAMKSQEYTVLFYTALGLSVIIPVVWFVFVRCRLPHNEDLQNGDVEMNLAEPFPRTGFAKTLAKLCSLRNEQAASCPRMPLPDPEVPLSVPTVALCNFTTRIASSDGKAADLHKAQHVSCTVPEVAPELCAAIQTWLMMIDTTEWALPMPSGGPNDENTSTTPIASPDADSQNEGMLASLTSESPLHPVLPPHVHILRNTIPGPAPPPPPAHPTKAALQLPSIYPIPCKSTFSNTTSSAQFSCPPPSITPSADVTSIPLIPELTPPPPPNAKTKAPLSPSSTQPSLSHWFSLPYLSTHWLDHMPLPSHPYWRQRTYHHYPDLLPIAPRFANDGIEHVPQWHQTEGWECSEEEVKKVMAAKKRQVERAEGRRKRQMMGRRERVWSVMGGRIGGREDDWEGEFGVGKERRLRDVSIFGRESKEKAGWECYHRF